MVLYLAQVFLSSIDIQTSYALVQLHYNTKSIDQDVNICNSFLTTRQFYGT